MIILSALRVWIMLDRIATAKILPCCFSPRSMVCCLRSEQGHIYTIHTMILCWKRCWPQSYKWRDQLGRSKRIAELSGGINHHAMRTVIRRYLDCHYGRVVLRRKHSHVALQARLFWAFSFGKLEIRELKSILYDIFDAAVRVTDGRTSA
jgi:hypothetical protein